VKSFRKARTPDDVRPQWRPIPAWTWTLIAIAAVALRSFVITTWLLTIASHAGVGANLAAARLDAVRTGLAAGGGAGAAVGLMLAFRRQHHQEIATLLTDQDATQRRITELYTKAVEQLGSDKAPVRLGGLYALERLAHDNLSQRQTIVNVICAYLRMPFPATLESGAVPGPDRDVERAETKITSGPSDNTRQQEKQVRLTAQRILSDHLRYEGTGQELAQTTSSRLWHGIRLDLTGATLIDVNLANCFIGDARFDAAAFSGDARFVGASFSGDARFAEASFSRIARFDAAAFNGDAGFGEATFSGAARFVGASFSGDARFAEATFSCTTWFDGATFSGTARFARVTFNSGARFAGVTFNGIARFTEATRRPLLARPEPRGIPGRAGQTAALGRYRAAPALLRLRAPGLLALPHPRRLGTVHAGRRLASRVRRPASRPCPRPGVLRPLAAGHHAPRRAHH